MKKILLIEPGTKLVTFPPIGLLHLSSPIREKYEIIIKDYSGKEIDKGEIKKIIQKIDPYVVGLRVLTGPHILRALTISKIAKELGKKVVWGGPHPTILPKQTLENENIDAVVIGEGEYGFQDLLKYFDGKNKNPRGVGIKKGKKITITSPNKKIVDLDKADIPAWDLLENINRYFPEKRHNILPISTTRGCAFKCGFCHNSNENVKKYLGCYRIASPEKAIKEYKFVQSLVKGEIDYLDVGEDLHLVSYDYAKKFCEAIKNSGRKDLKWDTSTRYSMLNADIINLIAKHNCKRILLGIESGSRRIQQLNHKIVELNHAIKIADLIRKNKIFITNAYIFGHPTETIEELKMTLKFIKKIYADENLIQLYRPMPGTPYFELCLKEGKIKNIPKELKNWSGFGVLGHDINVSKIPDKLLFSTFYKVNAWQQSKYIFNQQKYFLREGVYCKFFKNFINNRFIFKLKEFLMNKEK